MKARPEHEVAFADLAALVGKHAEKMTALELLAVASNMLGKLIALQDHRVTTAEQAMRVVVLNIGVGNEQVLAMNTVGSA
jgi:hypothetical protein